MWVGCKNFLLLCLKRCMPSLIFFYLFLNLCGRLCAEPVPCPCNSFSSRIRVGKHKQVFFGVLHYRFFGRITAYLQPIHQLFVQEVRLSRSRYCNKSFRAALSQLLFYSSGHLVGCCGKIGKGLKQRSAESVIEEGEPASRYATFQLIKDFPSGYPKVPYDSIIFAKNSGALSFIQVHAALAAKLFYVFIRPVNFSKAFLYPDHHVILDGAWDFPTVQVPLHEHEVLCYRLARSGGGGGLHW